LREKRDCERLRGCEAHLNKRRNMGLKTPGPSVKATLKAQFPSAFRTATSLTELREGLLGTQSRDDTVALVDGNVLLRRVPLYCQSYDAYCEFVFGELSKTFEAARTVVVVFDEPAAIPAAKKAEQRDRDAKAQAALAKKEQRQRQGAVVASEDLLVGDEDAAAPLRMEPNYTLEQIAQCPDVHTLKDDRRLRSRFFDAVIKRVYEWVQRDAAGMPHGSRHSHKRQRTSWQDARAAIPDVGVWLEDGLVEAEDGGDDDHEDDDDDESASALDISKHGVILLDGVDLRGATRGVDERRCPRIVGTNEELVNMLLRARNNRTIGEGDIKLLDLERRFADLRSEIKKKRQTRGGCNPSGGKRSRESGEGGESGEAGPLDHLAHTKLILSWTTDTDSIPISLMEAATRRCTDASDTTDATDATGQPLYTVLAMKERSGVLGHDSSGRSFFTVVDTVRLEGLLQARLWKRPAPPNPEQGAFSALAFATICLLGGSDFGTKVPGARFDHMLANLPVFITEHGHALAELGRSVDNDDATAIRAVSAVRALCCALSRELLADNNPHFRKQAGQLNAPPEVNLKRLVWVLGYWVGIERRDSRRFGFVD